MSRTCEHTRYLPSGLVHTPMGTCTCDRTPDPAVQKAEIVDYARRMWRARRPGEPFPFDQELTR